MVVGFRQKSVPWCTVKVIEGSEKLRHLTQEEEYGKFGVTTLRKQVGGSLGYGSGYLRTSKAGI